MGNGPEVSGAGGSSGDNNIMVTRSPAVTQRLVQVAQAAAQAGHGRKQAVYAAAATELGMSMATLMRALGEVALRPERRQRSDAGTVALTHDEAAVVSALMMESLRKNEKRLLSVGQALEIARSNGLVRAERVCPVTGEIVALSTSAVVRALRGYTLHPDQLLAPAPAVELQSLHSNHVWQIDASLCVLYYLDANCEAESGLQVMEHQVFNKNKPRNLKKIENERVWSYEVTDHTSGSIFLDYVLGAESGTNVSESFIGAITPREGDPFHGVPFVLMMDQGCASSALFMNLLRRLNVQALPHKAKNARATGQVENARNIIERGFESGLRFKPVRGLEGLRASARQWSRYWNATKVHTRHQMTRTEAWLRFLGEEHLRLAPEADICRALMTHAPEKRKVTDKLRVSFNGRDYDVRALPQVVVGEWVQVTYSPYVHDAAVVVDTGADGHETLHVVPLVQTNERGFAVTANVINEDYSRPPVTLADQNRDLVAKVAMGTTNEEELRALRKAKALPFGGRIDPYKPITDTTLPTFMPRRGTPVVPGASANTQAMPERVFTRLEAALELARRGVQMSPERNAQVAAWYPDGVPEGEMDDLVRRLAVRAQLRVVGGGGVAE